MKLTDEKAAQGIREAAENLDHDIESLHSVVDEIMLQLLEDQGFSETVAVVKNLKKGFWYA